MTLFEKIEGVELDAEARRDFYAHLDELQTGAVSEKAFLRYVQAIDDEDTEETDRLEAREVARHSEEGRGQDDTILKESMSPPSRPNCPSLLGEMAEIAESQLQALEVVYPGSEMLVAAADVPRYVTMEVVLDSGAGAHVANKCHVPGYRVVPSALSKLGAAFVAADGGKINNQGEALLSLVTKDAKGKGHAVSANFQIADVTRPLWLMGLICDSGLDVKFTAKTASILNGQGIEICHFERKHGLYIAAVQLENPAHESFGRQSA